jgi:hypothetical protein
LNTARFLSVATAFLAACLVADATGAQETSQIAIVPQATTVATQPNPVLAPPVAPPAVSPELADIYARLQSTEARLAELSSTQTTEAEQSRFRQYWAGVQDPSITTVGQQTRNQGGGGDEKEKAWYERLSIRGYAQFRLNEVFDEEGAPAQIVGDRSVGDNQTFLIRRARVIISGDVSERLYVYLQPDFASSAPGSPDATYFTQVRDWYGDVYLTDNKVHRVRVGQSKVPYGWENMQSSSNRIPLDRTDPINSSVRNERDLGAFYYWTPESAQDFFKYVLDEGLKGSGNYGVLGFGVYNGQGGSFLEQNDRAHVVGRLTLPFQLPSSQCVEVGIQAYHGDYVVLSSPIAPLGVGPAARPLGTLETGNRGIVDERIAGTFVWYPQPLGFQSEWNVGRGPGLNDEQTEVVERSLYGGYAMVMYRYVSQCHGTFFPFARWQYYQGGYKAERNAPFTDIDEFEVGVEWQFNKQMELAMQYTITDRTNTTAFSSGRSYEQFEGEILRMQFQINY